MEKKLFLFRANPDGINRKKEFLKDNFIAIGWNKLGELTNKNKNDIRKSLEEIGYPSSNTSVGQINHFVNTMEIGSLCLIPDEGQVFLAEITSDYTYNAESEIFKHTRSVKFLNADKPFNRTDFPEDLNKAIKPQMTIANMTHRLKYLEDFLNVNKVEENQLEAFSNEIDELLPKALENIREALEDGDLEVSMQLVKMLKNKKGDE